MKELSYWDGSRRSETRWKYSNTNKTAIDKVQAIVALSGYNSFLSTIPDKRGYPQCYEVHIRTNYQPTDGQAIRKEIVDNTDSLYCFQVSTGMLLVRRKGKVFVCGNTGKTTFLASEMSHFASQLGEDGCGVWFNNEEEGQKVKLRIIQAHFGVPLEELMVNLPQYRERYMEEIGSRLLFIDEPTLTKAQIGIS